MPIHRVALVLGNAAYPSAPLNNPVNDAYGLNSRLLRLGFETIVDVNSTYKDMDASLKRYSSMGGDEVGLVFFAGHGMQIDGLNYLAAVDTNFSSELDAKHSSLSLNKVIDVMELTPCRNNIIILDACRNNPYERKWRSSVSGLASVYAPRGMIICFATSPGQVAGDGDGKNGCYTSALLSHIDTEDLSVEELFKRVRNSLYAMTGGRQISWEHTSLMGEFRFSDSRIKGEVVECYSKNACADHGYVPSVSSIARDVIAGLGSHNWYRQNDAVEMLKTHKGKLSELTINDLFVVGRNVYQAACGSANTAIEYIRRFDLVTNGLDAEIYRHVLNGMLYEIYFDSFGNFRSGGLKTGMMDALFLWEEDQRYSESFKYISGILRINGNNMLYTPSANASVCLDLVLSNDKGVDYVSSVVYNQFNILRDWIGSPIDFKTDKSVYNEMSLLDIKSAISRAAAVPMQRLEITCAKIQNGGDVLFPSMFTLEQAR